MRIYLETFGCQMNELDSQLVRGQLACLGHTFTDDPANAELLLYNTCSVREHAEQKAYSRIGIVGQRKRAGEQLILGVIGCMAERDGLDMLVRHPQIDLLCGPGELDKLPTLIDNASRTRDLPRPDRAALAGNKSRRTATLAAADDDLESLDLARMFDPSTDEGRHRSAYVRITRGCNKFCTYCVVPHTRGAEVHRPPDHIIDECRRLADAGVIEVTLLGQTVNHYSYTHGVAVTLGGGEAPQVGAAVRASGSSTAVAHPTARRTTFAALLRRIHDEVPALQRIRFLTSYPRDFGTDALEAMRDCLRICPYLHAPAQSGSNRILRLMNRGYEVEEYVDFAQRAVETVPDLCLAGDFIVGFPTETDADFEATVTLVERLPFKNNFIFKYSPRPGTVAFDRLTDDIPDEVKRARNNRLLAVQAGVSARVHAGWIGRTVEVLIDSVREAPTTESTRNGVELRWERPKSALQLVGRTQGDLIVAAPTGHNDPCSLIGSIVRMRVEAAKPLLLQAAVISED